MMANQKRGSGVAPKQSLMTGAVQRFQENLAHPARREWWHMRYPNAMYDPFTSIPKIKRELAAISSLQARGQRFIDTADGGTYHKILNDRLYTMRRNEEASRRTQASAGRGAPSQSSQAPLVASPPRAFVAPTYHDGREPQRNDFPRGAQGNSLYNRAWLDYNRNRPGQHPTMVFDADTIKSGLGTGWAGWSSAVWNTPGLSDLNAKYHIYDPGSHQTEPGYKASLALGTLGRDAIYAAAGAKAGGLGARFVPVPDEPGLNWLDWWNKGIGTKVRPKDYLAYEIGQSTLSDEDFKKYGATEDVVQRGRKMIRDKKYLGKFYNAFKPKGEGSTLRTGPTPGSRAGLRALGLGGFLWNEYANNKPMWDEGWDDAVKSLR
jgi:hypothetical protein